MFFSMYYVKNNISKVERLLKKIKEGENLEDIARSILVIFRDIKLSLREIELQEECQAIEKLESTSLFGEMQEIEDYIAWVESSIQEVSSYDMESINVEAFRAEINSFLNYFITFDYANAYRKKFNTDTDDIGALERLRFLRKLSDLSGIEKEMNILQYDLEYVFRNGSGIFEDDETKNRHTYIVSNKPNIYRAYKEYSSTNNALTHSYDTRATNDAFDFVEIRPEIKFDLEDNLTGGHLRKKEKEIIVKTYRYIRKEGYHIITIPAYRMHYDLCTMLSRYYTSIDIYNADEFYGQIVLVCKKASVIKDRPELLQKIMNINLEELTIIDEIEIDNIKKISLPKGIVEINEFKGTVLDKDDLIAVMKKTSLLNRFKENIKVSTDTSRGKRPPLPFSIGQVGLILTSGCLDGVVDEGNGECHLVKGRVRKEYTRTSETNGDRMTEETRISNKVEINVILPNGEIKTLS